MKSHIAGRARWVALFSSLLLIASAVPVLAAGEVAAPEGPELSGKEIPTEEELAELPDSEDVGEAIGAYERELAEREEWLASPEAARQREASRLAFAGLDAEESEDLLLTAFAEQLEDLNGDPGRYLSTAQLVSDPAGPGATVRDEDGGSLLESSVPTRTENDQGQMRKVDLSLRAAPGGYETRNAISDLRLPASSRGEVAVGGEGFEIGQQGATQKAARRLGDKNLFYPEVLPDTDLFVAPTSLGVELFNVLRSERAPETLGFEVEVPAGAVLRSDGRGGAEVVREGETLQRIPKPWAIDAQQAEVPVALAVEGDSIALRVPHRQGDHAYPILVDPIVEDWVNTENSWRNGHNLDALSNGAWQWTSNNGGIDHDICCWEGSKPGLLTIFDDGSYGSWQHGQWSYSTPNEDTYIYHAWLIPFNRADFGCGSDRPRDYVGMWNSGDWHTLEVDRAESHGNASFDGYGKALVLGLGSGSSGGLSLGCDRILYAGGVGIWLDDHWGPGIDYAGVPSGEWFGDQEDVDIKVESRDLGLGVHRVKLLNEGKGIVAQDSVGNCTGLYGSRCPTHRTSNFDVSGDSFGQGIRDASVIVTDPTGKTEERGFTTKVDNSKPQVALEGQLARATGEKVDFEEGENPVGQGEDELSLPVYRLLIKARDGSRDSDKDKRSGVKDVRVSLDGEPQDVPWQPTESCPLTSCEMEVGYELALSEIEAAGKHTLEVTAEDFVGEVKTRNIEFEYFPATGIKDDYAMHYFPLPDGQGEGEEGEESGASELAVNVMNGNLVYHERDIDVEGPSVDLEVERYYNSQLPEEENTEWGDGWTLAQTPDLEPEGGLDAKLVDQSGSVNDKIELPAEEGEETFDNELGARLEKKAYGAYELTTEGGEAPTSTLFDAGGRAEAELTEGAATVDYVYEGEELAEIAVDDPGSAGNPTEAPEEAEAPEDEPQPGDTPVFAGAFGSQGSGPGQLNRPADLALAADGTLWVVDKSNNRVQHLGPEGEFISSFGSYGIADGQFNRPASIAIDAAGDLWVTDANNHRVQKFDDEGGFLAKFGSQGSGNGQFSGPEGIAIDGEGNLWISDTYNGRIQQFDPEGNFLQVVGSHGSGEGQIGEATGIDVGPEGNVWIADWQNNRVSVFDPEGGVVNEFGSAGSGDGEFHRPDAIDVDEQGNVWVGDQNNDRIQRFDLDGDYVDQFGGPGTGEGQFNFSWPMGLFAGESHIWVSDTFNHRIQKWEVPGASEYFIGYGSSFGDSGPEAEQLDTPADIAETEDGDLWVADSGKHRVQRYGASGEYLGGFGEQGSEAGQLSSPSSLAIDAQGDIWVADTNNLRLQQFDPEGQYLSQIPLGGSFAFPLAVALDAEDNVLAYDWAGGLRRFDQQGELLGVIGSNGSEPGQIGQTRGIDIDGNGRIWVADWGNDRVSVFDSTGEFQFEFGSEGSGPGQFETPAAIDIGAEGSAWVLDRDGNRLQRFDSEGEFLAEAGPEASGDGAYQIAWPAGILADETGLLRFTDSGGRIQEWIAYEHAPASEAPEEEPVQDDPKVEVETPEGMVASVEGEEAGQHTYEHEGELLVSHEDTEGKTEYEYDEEERLTKVTLPNGTWAEIEYYDDNRVKSVAVDPAGEAPESSTHFYYEDASPRETIADPSNVPRIYYDIGDDGSILKWWNKETPPELDLHGSLYDNREEDGALWSGDLILEAEAEDAEGVASIEIIAEGDALVAELHCEQDLGDSDVECVKRTKSWVTNTGAHAAGHLQIEVIATDSNGKSASERFWVDIPEPPPPPAPGTPVPPSFEEIKEFREEFGLEEVFPVDDETELIERIFDLIKAWHEPGTPEGEVARASANRWGVPLRPVDVAELEYRLEYQEDAAHKIPDREYEENPDSYAGMYYDEASGGKIRVGSTGDEEAAVEDLTQSVNLMAPDRIDTFDISPDDSLTELETLEDGVADASEEPEGFPLTTTSIDVIYNRLDVRSTNVGAAEASISAVAGGQDYTVSYEAPTPPRIGLSQIGEPPNPHRERIAGPIRAGDRLHNPARQERSFCSAGYGMWRAIRNPKTGALRKRYFMLAAGHCYRLGEKATRRENPGAKDIPVGNTVRTGLEYAKDEDRFDTDAVVIRLWAGRAAVPRRIVDKEGPDELVRRPRRPVVGMWVCNSGASSKKQRCGKVRREVGKSTRDMGSNNNVWIVPFGADIAAGDSGSPVFALGSKRPVGIIQESWEKNGEKVPPAYFTPLLARPKHGRTPGILGNDDFRKLHLVWRK